MNTLSKDRLRCTEQYNREMAKNCQVCCLDRAVREDLSEGVTVEWRPDLRKRGNHTDI